MIRLLTYLLKNGILENEFKIFNEMLFCCAIPKNKIETASRIYIIHVSKLRNNKTINEIIAIPNKS